MGGIIGSGEQQLPGKKEKEDDDAAEVQPVRVFQFHRITHSSFGKEWNHPAAHGQYQSDDEIQPSVKPPTNAVGKPTHDSRIKGEV